jgi:SAM-dependent methyltransferase
METSWEQVASWYDRIVGSAGHYFHETIIIPNLLKLFALDKTPKAKVLDLGCGSGVLLSNLPKNTPYLGIDISPEMVRHAKKNSKGSFLVQDLTEPLSLPDTDYTHVVSILALQNMEHPEVAIANGVKHLAKDGTLFLILNHPYFRIPRQSSWGVDQDRKIQYRRIDRYLSPLAIPIDMHPGKEANQKTTLSYHFPLSYYINTLGTLGMGITHMEEWTSKKVSTGKFAKMEDRARSEFPLFLLLMAKRF